MTTAALPSAIRVPGARPGHTNPGGLFFFAFLMCFLSGLPPATVVAVGEMQVARHPRLTHTQTNPAAFWGNSAGPGSVFGQALTGSCKVTRSRSKLRVRTRWSRASAPTGEREMTKRGKCGGRAGRRLGTPRATGTRCSPRLHKPSWTDWATPRRAIPQPPAVPRARGALGLSAPRALAPAARPLRTLPPRPFFLGLFLFFPFSHSLQRALQPAAKFSHDPGNDIRETVERRAGVRSTARSPSPAGKLRGRVPSSHSSAAEKDSGAAGPRRARSVAQVPPGRSRVGVEQSTASGTLGTGYPPLLLLLQPPLPPPPPPAPLAPVTLTRGFTLRS